MWLCAGSPSWAGGGGQGGRLQAGIGTFLVLSQARGLPFLLPSSSRAEHRSALQLMGTTPGRLFPKAPRSHPLGLRLPGATGTQTISRITSSCPLLSRSCVSMDVLPSFLQTSMSVRSGLTTATCTPPASTCPGASNASVAQAGLGMG